MALQIRRGLDADLPASPADGELLYATDTNKLYVGDGGVAQEISGGTGITDIVNDVSPQLGGNLDVNTFSIISASNNNIVLNPNGTGYISLQSTVVVGDTATSQDGNLIITRDTYSSAAGAGLLFSQHHETQDAVNVTMYRSRGSSATPTIVRVNDELGELVWAGHDGINPIAGAVITATVDGPVTTNRVPSKLSFLTNSTTGASVRAELSSTGVWKTNQLGALTGTTVTIPTGNNITVGDIKLDQNGLSTINTNASLTLAANGTGAVNVESISIIGNTVDTTDSSTINFLVNATFNNDVNVENDLRVTNKVYAESFVSTSVGTPTITSATSIQLAAATGVVISGSPLRMASLTSGQRDALTAQNGDVIYNTTTNKFQGYENGAWVNLI